MVREMKKKKVKIKNRKVVNRVVTVTERSHQMHDNLGGR